MSFQNFSTAGNFIPSKSQYYVNDGTGRDSYIFNINGGNAPEKKSTKIHDVGKIRIKFLLTVIRFFRIFCYAEAGICRESGQYSLQTRRLRE